MNFLPKAIEDIIINYKNDMDKIIARRNIRDDIFYILWDEKKNRFTNKIAKSIIRSYNLHFRYTKVNKNDYIRITGFTTAYYVKSVTKIFRKVNYKDSYIMEDLITEKHYIR